MALPPQAQWEKQLEDWYGPKPTWYLSPDKGIKDPNLLAVGKCVRTWNATSFKQWVHWERTYDEWEWTGTVDDDLQESPHEMVRTLPNHAGLMEAYGDEVRLRHSADCLAHLDEMDAAAANAWLQGADRHLKLYLRGSYPTDSEISNDDRSRLSKFDAFLLFIANNIQSTFHIINPKNRTNLTADRRDGPAEG